MIDSYLTIEGTSEGVFKDRGSKFLAFAFPVSTEEEISEIQKNLRKKYFDARHHVYAFRLGAEKSVFRASDDGEPSNSSGPPVLGQIRSFDLTNILIVVVRYFGGTKLGVPGLINAYKSAAHDAIANAKIISKTVCDLLEIRFEYPAMNDIMRIVKDENLEIANQSFEMNCVLKLWVRRSNTEYILNKLALLRNNSSYICNL